MALNDQRITKDGVIVIKAQIYRSQDKNKLEAMARLQEIVESVATVPRVRKPTKPTRGSQTRRLDGKSVRSHVKSMRGKVTD